MLPSNLRCYLFSPLPRRGTMFPARDRIRLGGDLMASDGKRAFDRLLKTYLSLGDSARTLVRQLKKTSNAISRRKMVGELRNLDMKRLELLDQMDNLANST